tara:strand:+ start:15288 stop:15413 length:126 start_codon:yes stop_codon:yes gene_type:complete
VVQAVTPDILEARGRRVPAKVLPPSKSFDSSADGTDADGEE